VIAVGANSVSFCAGRRLRFVSFHALVKEKPGRTPLSTIKLMKGDPAAMEAQREEIKTRYSRIFGV
jgi:hypothetical protein